MRVKKVLVCSVPCWNQKTGSDTFSSLLDGYGADCVANLYIRPGVPDSDVCKRYFRITENAIIKSIFNRAIKTGETVDNTSSKTCEDMHDISIVSAQYKGASKKRNYFLLLVREVLWKLGKWKTNELDTFLDEFKPDVVFFAMEGYIHFNRINRYIIKRTGARGVGYFWDDNFSYKQSASLGHRIYRFFQRRDLKKTVCMCDDFFAIAPKTKREADEFFGIDCKILTKPMEVSNSEFEEYVPSSPLKILYTGKLIIGRFDTIKTIGRALDEINSDSVKIELDIYTTTELSENETADLSKHVHLLGAVPQSEVAKVQSEADVLLFAEAISGANSKTARLSFSTKLTDYFRSGKCILAVRNEDIAPIEYLRENNAALVATSFDDLLDVLRTVVADNSVVCKYAQSAYECGKKNHDKEKVQRILFDTLNG